MDHNTPEMDKYLGEQEILLRAEATTDRKQMFSRMVQVERRLSELKGDPASVSKIFAKWESIRNELIGSDNGGKDALEESQNRATLYKKMAESGADNLKRAYAKNRTLETENTSLKAELAKLKQKSESSNRTSALSGVSKQVKEAAAERVRLKRESFRLRRSLDKVSALATKAEGQISDLKYQLECAIQEAVDYKLKFEMATRQAARTKSVKESAKSALNQPPKKSVKEASVSAAGRKIGNFSRALRESRKPQGPVARHFGSDAI